LGYSVKLLLNNSLKKERMMQKEMTKSLPVSKRMVWNSYLKVTSNQGGAGIDDQSIEGFNEDLSKNLYKLWNRMSSGCYFPPPVSRVFIPKKQGGIDIKGFFDNISHSILMDLLRQHTEEKWILMYVERWLKAGVEQSDGSIVGRTQGTPQGGVVSPLLANIYLHHAFDKWMDNNQPNSPFERYADDIVIHCETKAEAERILEELNE
jgi:RNA-directed DNA polymerase